MKKQLTMMAPSVAIINAVPRGDSPDAMMIIKAIKLATWKYSLLCYYYY